MAPSFLLRTAFACALAAAPAAHAVTLQDLAAHGGTLSAGGLVFSNFRIEPVPIVSPQGALVNDGADLDVSTLVAGGRVGLHLLQVDPQTLRASPLTVDLATNGEKNFLRNISYTVTVADPALRLHAATLAVGPGTGALKEVSGFVGTFIGAAHSAFPGVLNNSGQIVDPALGASFIANPPGLPGGDVLALDADTAWTLTTGHARGATPVGSGHIDFIDVTWTLAAAVPEPASVLLWAAGLGLLGWRARRHR